MRCPNCKSVIPESSGSCPICGRALEADAAACRPPQGGTFFALGDLDATDQGTDTAANGDHVVEPSRGVSDTDEAGSFRDKAAAGMEQPPETPQRDTLFCTGCGKPTPADAVFCEHCGKKLLPDSPKEKFQWKKSMPIAICCTALWIGILMIFCGWLGQVEPVPEDGASLNEDGIYPTPLCDTCDYTLCRGTDVSGNIYELVANQTESALGYEITVGVIKNNAWIYPLSADFPFLGEDGLFHVGGPGSGKSGISLEHVGTIIRSVYFIDSGAFLLDCYTETDSLLSTSDHIKIIFSCDSLKSYTVNCKEATILYRYSKATFSNGSVTSYGRISSENGTLILYSETSGTSSGWLENQVFDWYALNVQTLEVETLAANVEGIRPESALSEGLIFASDQCFYNTSVQKVIDLSAYDIDMWYTGDIFFEGGTCTFTAENALGTEFLITIDKSGNIISEIEKEM